MQDHTPDTVNEEEERQNEGEPEVGPVAPPAWSGRWSPSLRWFGAEFLVVVSGVLVALALNAYVGSRQEAARERAYLVQLAADLRQSEQAFTAVIEQNEAAIDRLQRLSNAFTATPPPPDSALARLISVGFSTNEPMTGTGRALLQTGDLHLIQDDSIRSAVIGFDAESQAFAERARLVEWNWLLPAVQRLYSFTHPWAQGDHPFAVPVRDLLEEREFYLAVQDLLLAFDNYVRMQRSMLEEVEAVRAYVEAALGETAA
jgi:hypothetical protein